MNGPADAGPNNPTELEHSRSPSSSGALRGVPLVDIAAVAGFKLLVSALVLARGFRAISDDDYARVVIAQRFAESPALDPSGTSWLPLPFWLYGSAFYVFGSSLEVARAVAVSIGAFSSVLVLVAARFLGASRCGGLIAGFVAGALTHSAWLGAATVPETLSAALTLLGIAGFASAEPRRRVVGAVAIAAACFCRYEAWAVALSLGAYFGFAAVRKRELRLAATCAIALAPIALWVLHGVVRHGDALFFWKRVTDYKLALGGSDPALLRAFSPPLLLLVKEWPLTLALLGAFLWLRARRVTLRVPGALVLALAAAALLSSLMLGEATGGAPTHHPERALLPLFYLGAALLGLASSALLSGQTPLPRAALASIILPLLAASLVRASEPHGFVDRSLAVDIGERARELGAPALRIDSPDYAYLAVSAGFGRPSRAEPFDDHDPRKPRPGDAFANPDTLRRRLGDAPTFVVATRAHEAVASALGPVRASNAAFVLVDPRLRSP